MGTMEEEECRGKADNSPAAAPLQPKAPHSCLSRPANGGIDNRRKGSGKEMAPTSGNPKARKKEPPPPPPPPGSAYNHQYERRKRSASRTARHAERISQQGNPRRASSHKTPSGKTAGVPRPAEKTHQGGSARADNTRSRSRKKKIQHRWHRKKIHKANTTGATREGGLQR